MRTENLFKFVAIRAPLPRGEGPSPVPAPPRSVITARIRASVEAGQTLEDARRARASEFMDSNEYVTRNPQWKPFLAIEAWVRRLLAEISPSEDLRSAIERLLVTPVGHAVTLDAFVASPEFGHLKESLWDSYHCHVILLDRRPQDRPRLLFWIRFWRLMERLANGEQAPALVAEFGRWLPTVPHLLIRAERSAQADSAVSVELSDSRFQARRREIASAKTEINELKVAHAHIVHLVEAGTLRPQEVDRAVLATLARHGLTKTLTNGPDLVSRLEHRIAVADNDIGALREVEQVVTVGGVLVVRRRELSDDELEGRELP